VVTSLELRGRGNGHGVGMCQWGAIGRARAGQDYRLILNTYYPGTVLARVD
jgi:stage II sporulation protein D